MSGLDPIFNDSDHEGIELPTESTPHAEAKEKKSLYWRIQDLAHGRCRVSVDGPIFRASFPPVAWLVGDDDLQHWRGQLDYWVFLDGALGQVAGSVNGQATGIEDEAIQGRVEVFLTATDRGGHLVIDPPTP